MTEQVESVISNALLKTSDAMGIDLKNLRIQMKLDADNGHRNVSCHAMEGTLLKGNVSWNKILGLKFLAFKGIIVSSIEKKLLHISDDLNISQKDINVRFYAIDKKGTPNVYLFNDNKGVKGLKLKELI